MKRIFTKIIIVIILATGIGFGVFYINQVKLYNLFETQLIESDLNHIDRLNTQYYVLLDLLEHNLNEKIERKLAEISDYNNDDFRRNLESLRAELGLEMLMLLDKNNKLKAHTKQNTDEYITHLLTTYFEQTDQVMLDVKTLGYIHAFKDQKVWVSIVIPLDDQVKMVAVGNLTEQLLVQYPISIYETLHLNFYHFKINSDDFDADYTVEYWDETATLETLSDALTHDELNQLMDTGKVIVKTQSDIYIYAIHTLPKDKWLKGGSLVYKTHYTNFKLKQMFTQNIRNTIIGTSFLFVLGFLILFIILYQGLIRQMEQVKLSIKQSKNLQYKSPLLLSKIDEVNFLLAELEEMRHIIVEREEFIAEMSYFDTITGVGNIYLLEKDLSKNILEDDHKDYISIVAVQIVNDREIIDQIGNDKIYMFLSDFVAKIKASFGRDAVYRKSDYTFVAISRVQLDYGVVNQIELFMMSLNDIIFEAKVNTKIVVARYPEHGDNAVDLINNLEITIQSKSDQTILFYSKQIKDAYLRQLQIEMDLKNALVKNEIKVVYQPIVNPYTMKIEGVEALVRWERVRGEHIRPDEFIPIAEKLGIIHEIDQIVFDKSCHMLMLWEEIYDDPFFISVNSSPIWFMNPEYLPYIQDKLEQTGIDPKKICLEIIETCLIENIENANEVILGAKKLGCRIALDDFGKGYSSLNYLRKLEIDKLKIDKDFLTEMDLDSEEYNIIDSIVDMAHHMNFDIVVEGVEELNQLEYLMQLNVEQIQGYLFSKPREKEEISQILLSGGIIRPTK